MTDYIQDGWGNKGLWTLNNATWDTWGGYDSLLTGNGVIGGYGEKSYADIINNNWYLTIAKAVSFGLDIRGVDVQIFLDGDVLPIIFRYNYDDPNGSITFYIIYNSIIRDTHVIGEWDSFSSKIYRLGSVYYFTSFDLSFDYGSTVKPVKLKIATSGNNFSTHWYNLQWYYVIAESYGFIL